MSMVLIESLLNVCWPLYSQFSKHDGVMHVLVTGGAGFIGSHAALRLLEDNHRVTIVVCCVHKTVAYHECLHTWSFLRLLWCPGQPLSWQLGGSTSSSKSVSRT